MIPDYPEFREFDLSMRDELHPLFINLKEGISEFTFANIYLFRKKNTYLISRLPGDQYIIAGNYGGKSFFLLPFGLPDSELLKKLFNTYDYMKLVSVSQAKILEDAGYHIEEDRNNFDYVYLRKDLALLKGRKFHKKRNLVTLFRKNYTYSIKSICETNIEDALYILEKWKSVREDQGDYVGAKEALLERKELDLCGNIVYIGNQPAAYILGEELAGGTSYAVHFEKAVEGYKGIYQFVNKVFALFLPDRIEYINREQDMGDEGLRQAKLSYRPYHFIKKYKAKIDI